MDDESRTRAQRLAALVADLDRLIRADVKRGSGAPRDLTLTQVHVLAYVAQDDRPSQIDIARSLRVTGPTLVRVLDTLERKGLVTRTRPARSPHRAYRPDRGGRARSGGLC